MAFQKLQRSAVELFDLLINRRVSTAFEDHKLGITDAILKPIGKASRRQQVALSEGDLRGDSDASELRFHVVSEYCIGLLQEGRQ